MLRLTFVRTIAQPAAARRSLSTSPALFKTATDKVKDTVKSADRTISDAAVAGINKGEAAAKSAKETVTGKAKEAQHKAKETAEDVQDKASDASSKAKQEVDKRM